MSFCSLEFFSSKGKKTETLLPERLAAAAAAAAAPPPRGGSPLLSPPAFTAASICTASNSLPVPEWTYEVVSHRETTPLVTCRGEFFFFFHVEALVSDLEVDSRAESGPPRIERSARRAQCPRAGRPRKEEEKRVGEEKQSQKNPRTESVSPPSGKPHTLTLSCSLGRLLQSVTPCNPSQNSSSSTARRAKSQSMPRARTRATTFASEPRRRHFTETWWSTLCAFVRILRPGIAKPEDVDDVCRLLVLAFVFSF